jgi:hypothetical protein
VAQRVEMQITCDRVAPGHGGEVESLDMTLGGTEYQIDLCAKHRKPYNDLLEMITMDGRRVSTRAGNSQPPQAAQPDKPQCRDPGLGEKAGNRRQRPRQDR